MTWQDLGGPFTIAGTSLQIQLDGASDGVGLRRGGPGPAVAGRSPDRPPRPSRAAPASATRASRQVPVGSGFAIAPDRLAVVLRRERRCLGQQLRVHPEQRGPRPGFAGRPDPGRRDDLADGRRLGRRDLPDFVPGRPRRGYSSQEVQVLVNGQVVGTVLPPKLAYPYSQNFYQGYSPRRSSCRPARTRSRSRGFTQSGPTRPPSSTASRSRPGSQHPPGHDLPTVGDVGFRVGQASAVGTSPTTPAGSAWTFVRPGARASRPTARGSPRATRRRPQGSQVAFLQGDGARSPSRSPAGPPAPTRSPSTPPSAATSAAARTSRSWSTATSSAPSSRPATSYQAYTTAPFTVSAGSHTIEFLAWTPPGATTPPSSTPSPSPPSPRRPPTVGDSGFESEAVGASGFAYDPGRVGLDLLRRAPGVSGNGSALHLGQPGGPAGLAGRLPPGRRGRSPSRSPAGPPAPTRSPSTRRSGATTAASEDFEVLVDGTSSAPSSRPATRTRPTRPAPFTVSAGSHTVEFLGSTPPGATTPPSSTPSRSPRSPPASPRLGDSGFEAVARRLAGYAYDPAGSAWTFAGTSGVSGNNSPASPRATRRPRRAPRSPSSRGPAGRSPSRSPAGRPAPTRSPSTRRSGATSAGSEDFEVLVDGNVVGTFKPVDDLPDLHDRDLHGVGRVATPSSSWASTPPGATTPPSSTPSPSPQLAARWGTRASRRPGGSVRLRLRPRRVGLDVRRRVAASRATTARLHLGQPGGPAGLPGRLPPGDRRRSPRRSPAGRPAPTRSPSTPRSAATSAAGPGLRGPGRRQRRRDVHAQQDGLSGLPDDPSR